MSATPSVPPLHHGQPADVALGAYLGWRQECATVWDAYGRWSIATAEDEVPAYAAYQAALDREEAAANAYATLVAAVRDLRPAAARTATPTQYGGTDEPGSIG